MIIVLHQCIISINQSINQTRASEARHKSKWTSRSPISRLGEVYMPHACVCSDKFNRLEARVSLTPHGGRFSHQSRQKESPTGSASSLDSQSQAPNDQVCYSVLQLLVLGLGRITDWRKCVPPVCAERKSNYVYCIISATTGLLVYSGL